MEAVAEQGVLFPLSEQKAGRRSPLRQMLDAIERHGSLLPRAWIPMAVDLSRQRVKVLIDEGRIATVLVSGREFVPLASLEAFLADERKAGRPVEVLSDRETLRRIVGKK